MMSQNFAERRREFRLPYQSKVILTDGRISSTAYGANISRGGVFVMTLDPFPIDTKVLMAFLLPQQPNSVCVKGKIAHIVFDRQRAEIECGMGIQFLDLNESQKSLLNLHILNEKMAYLEMKKLLSSSHPNVTEIQRLARKLPILRTQADLLALRYRVNRICTLFEPAPNPHEEDSDSKEKLSIAK